MDVEGAEIAVLRSLLQCKVSVWGAQVEVTIYIYMHSIVYIHVDIYV